VALFQDQLTIVGTSSTLFSAGGDSGWLIWTWDSRSAPVGLLFAGGGSYTFANKIQRVLASFGYSPVYLKRDWVEPSKKLEF
jgi:hypothetical protein